MPNTFLDKLALRWKEGKFACVGLDKGEFEFDKNIIDQTQDLVCCFKPNIAFYEAQGLKGLKSLEQTIDYIHKNYPDIPVLLDAKVADIDNTNISYAKAIFDWLKADALTINPYPGKEAMTPFLNYADKGIFVWIKASNIGSEEFQNLEDSNKKPLYQIIAQNVSKNWNTNSNCGLVVGATYPEELRVVREIVGDIPILIPGVGAQGGDISQIVKAGINSKNEGIIVSSSRGIIFSDNPREATLKLHQEIQDSLK